jgi:hypothetical protein
MSPAIRMLLAKNSVNGTAVRLRGAEKSSPVAAALRHPTTKETTAAAETADRLQRERLTMETDTVPLGTTGGREAGDPLDLASSMRASLFCSKSVLFFSIRAHFFCIQTPKRARDYVCKHLAAFATAFAR